MKKYLWGALILVVLLATASLAANAQATDRDLSGWAWSSNTGWVSFNSTDAGAGGGPYKVQLKANGDLTGYAWSSNIGWIKFDPSLTGTDAPVGAAKARVNTANGQVSGYIRACAGTVNKDCNVGTRTDGWDGWISLSGTNHDTGNNPTNDAGNGGVTYVESGSTATLKGYSWGSDVVGWLRFSPTATVDTKVKNDSDDSILSFSATSGASSGRTLSVTQGSLVNFDWTIENLEDCTRSESPSGYWSTINTSNSISGDHLSTYSGSGGYTFGTVGTYDFGITCKIPGSMPIEEISQSVTIVVSGSQPLTCSVPTHSNECGVAPDFIYNSRPNSSYRATDLRNNCPTSGGPFYCVYTCESGYEKNGNRCVISDLEEF
ncbi:MAG: hypothetical protein KBC33_01595 [Candidatus Pacebacteria bacterium]|nr:hypothetical protein [Candidatus Paceibacterota bacterium]